MLGRLRALSAESFAWLLPLVVVAEYVGTTFGNTVAATCVLFAVLAGALWLSPPERLSPLGLPSWTNPLARVLGVVLLGIGVYGMWHDTRAILDPTRFAPPVIRNLRERELFLWAGVLWAYPAALGLRLIDLRSKGRHYERLGLSIALVLLAHLAGKQPVQGLAVLPYARPGMDAVLVTAAVVLVALMFVPRVPGFIRVLALLGAGLGLRFVGLETWKIDPAVRDMLPLVQSAEDSFIRGDNPYSLHQMQAGSVVPLTYLPGMWLGWAPFRLLGADFRWMGLVADAAVVGGAYWAASRVRAEWRERGRGIALGFGAVWLFSPSVAWNGIYAEPHVWWLFLALTLAGTVTRRWWLASVALALALATRHFAVIVAPFVVVAMWRDLGWRRLLPRLALTGTLTALLYLPFVLRDPETFWFGTYRWLVEYGPVHQDWFWEKFGFSGPLYKAKATEWMPRAQLALPLALLLGAIFVRGRRRAIAPLGTAYASFVMFNGIIWDSFYLGCSLFALFAAAAGYELAPRMPSSPLPSPRALRLSGALVALALASGGWLALTLVRSQRTDGASEARALFASSMTSSDVLVDRTDWNVAFVRGKPLFAGTPMPGRVGRDVFDPVLGPAGPFGRERALFAFHVGRDRALQKTLMLAGRVLESRVVGSYRLLTLADLNVARRFTEDRALPVVRPCTVGGLARPLGQLRAAKGQPASVTLDSVTLTKKLVLLAGPESSSVVWGRQPLTLTLRIDGSVVSRHRIQNLPKLGWAVSDTSRFEGRPHTVELTLTTGDEKPRTVCVDGWVMGR